MADSIFPNYVRQNADGTVGGVFPGGVELNSADSTKSQPPASENSIQWVRQQDGALIAQIYSSVEEPGSVVGFSEFDLQVFDPDSKGAQLYLSAQPDQNTPNRGAAVSINSGSTGNVGQVSVNAWDANGNESYAHVIAGDGSSGFLQLALNGNYKSQIVTGQVTWPGGTPYSSPAYYNPNPVPTNGQTFAICSATSDVTSAGAFVGIGLIRGYDEGNYVAFSGQPVNGSSPPAGSICNFAAIVFWRVS